VKIFATYSIKGGVGKTTAAVNLAYLSAADGYRTLLWDLDPQGAASFLRGDGTTVPTQLAISPQRVVGVAALFALATALTWCRRFCCARAAC